MQKDCHREEMFCNYTSHVIFHWLYLTISDQEISREICFFTLFVLFIFKDKYIVGLEVYSLIP